MADTLRPALLDAEDDDAILQELRDRYDYASTSWQPIYDEGDTDMRYIAADTWTSDDRKLWVGRPMMEFDQLGQYLNQLVNAIRQNKRAIKVSADGNGANDQTAEVRAGRIKQIEYLSHASEVYTAAFSGAAERSYGFCRIVAEYASPKAMTPSLRLKAIPNPNQCLPDFDAQSMAGADWKYFFFKYPMPRAEFKRDYPDAKTGDFSKHKMKGINDIWGSADHVMVVEYWRVTTDTRTLIEWGVPGQSVTLFESELADRVRTLPPGGGELNRRDAEVPVVSMYLSNGLELLAKKGKPKKTPWPGSYIPFASCYGKVLYLTDEAGNVEKQILSFIRHGRSPQKYYNWLASKEASAVAMQINTPLRAYRGQLNTDELDLVAKSMHQPVAVITHGAMTEATGGQVLPPPSHEMIQANLQEYEMAKEAARRDIQNALGRYSASVGRADTNVKSGVALQQLDKQSDQGSYHFVDNFDTMIRHVGVMLDELLAFYDDTAKDITTRKPDDTTQTVRVNDPNHPESVSMTQGDHTVTIGTGPDFDSQRAEASAFADSIIQNPQMDRILGPQKTTKLLGMAIKLKNVGPIGDAMVEIVDPKDPNDPKMAAQQLQEVQQQLQHAEQVMGQLHTELQQEKTGGQLKLALADKDNQAKAQIEAQRSNTAADAMLAKAVMDNARAIAVAHIGANARGADINAHAAEEQLALSGAMLQRGQDHAHEARMFGLQHDSDTLQSAQDHGEALEASAQDHGQAMDAMAQMPEAMAPDDGTQGETPADDQGL